MGTSRERLIKRIQNLLKLAGNNPNEYESSAAALKAQALMEKYHISMEEVGWIPQDTQCEESVQSAEPKRTADKMPNPLEQVEAHRVRTGLELSYSSTTRIYIVRMDFIDRVRGKMSVRLYHTPRTKPMLLIDEKWLGATHRFECVSSYVRDFLKWFFADQTDHPTRKKRDEAVEQEFLKMINRILQNPLKYDIVLSEPAGKQTRRA